MAPAAARRRPIDAVAAARRAPAARARAAASVVSVRGGRRRPSFLCVGSMASREASRLNFARLPDALFYVLLRWRLSVVLAAPALDTKTAVSSNFKTCFVRRLVRCPVRLSILRLPYRKTDRFCGALQGLSRTRRLKEQAVSYLSYQFKQFLTTGFYCTGISQAANCKKQAR